MSVKFFEDVTEEDIVGGKGASLVKMYQNNFNVPNGFIIIADSFDEFLMENGIKEEIEKIMDECDINNEKDIEIKSNKISQIISKCDISYKIQEEIRDNYQRLNCKYVAVRSSATSEDGENHAWAGQLETFLNVDETNIVECVKNCWSSVFSPRALFYRIKNKDTSDIKVAVVVQRMIQSEKSGVAFSINPTNQNLNEAVIEAVFGLGEAIVSGKVTPDTYIVNKNANKIESKKIKIQKSKLMKSDNGNRWEEVLDGNEQKLDDEMILKLSSLLQKIEEFYGFAVDVEWGMEGNMIYILQGRPITTVKKNKLVEKVKKTDNWEFYVSRKFNWFVEKTEIYSTLEEYQKELLGFELATQNYLCLNGDEYISSLDFKILCEKLDTYFEKDVNFFEKFAKVEFDLVKEVKDYLEYLEKKRLCNLSLEELVEEVEKFNRLYIKSFIPGMTRPEEYLMDKLEKELQNEKFTKEEIAHVFSKICTCPNYYPLSYTEEPLDLLKIALVAENGNNIEKLVENHIEKYAWIKEPVGFENTAFSKEDYLERINNLINFSKDEIEKKIENINDVRKNNDREYEKILHQYKFSIKAEKLIKAIRDFIFLRTYTTEYSDHLFFCRKTYYF